MKPTFQINRPASRGDSQHSFGGNTPKTPAVDWLFQSPATQLAGGGAVALGNRTDALPSAPRLWSLSQGFIEAEAKREYRLEAMLFAVVAALAAWPIGFAFYMASETVR